MKLPLSFINEFVDITDISLKEYEHKLTMSGSKVEGIEDFSKEITNVKTGKIIGIQQHPDAEKLVVCQVSMGANEIQIVTGAKNMGEGDIVPVALHKSTLVGGVKIEKGKLRGVLSEGMFCSTDEIGIGDPNEKASGLMILPENTPIGEDIVKVLNLCDPIVEFEITSNRPDCLSAIGLARETAATFGRKLTVPTPKFVENNKNIDDLLKVRVENEQVCKRYMARVVQNIKIEKSPKWLQKRLSGCGVRPINNIVDITNLVMLEYGQPMHAFDISFVKDGQIVVRNAKKEENITTLDGIKRDLSEDMLVICDREKPMAVAGVMGGEFSGIIDTTKTIVFESASFSGVSVRKTAKKLGIRTESSSRYEKGLDKNMTVSALDRACQLICQLNCGEIVGGVIDVDTPSIEKVKIPFNPDKINAFLGANISREEMITALKALEFTIENDMIIYPDFRIDIECFNDIAEEIVRIYGYDKIPTAPLFGSNFEGGLNREQKLERQVKYNMVGNGFSEIYTYSFESPKVFDMLNLKEENPLRNVIKITNPLGYDLSIMRSTPLFGMLTSLAANQKKRAKSANLFEIAKTYIPIQADELPLENKVLTAGAYGAIDFYNMKGISVELAKVFNIKNLTFESVDTIEYLHPYRSAKILYNGMKIGEIGQIHPIVASKFDIVGEAFILLLEFSEIIKLEIADVKYKPLNRFPSSEKDFSVTVSDDVTAFEIEEIARKVAGKLLTSIELFDIYKGEKIPVGKKSVSFNFLLEDYTRTLTDEETNGILMKIMDEVNKKFG